MNLKVCWMYHDIMDLYGDKGNMLVLQKRCEDRGISIKIDTLSIGDTCDLSTYDLLFFGGGADKEQLLLIDCFNYEDINFSKQPEKIQHMREPNQQRGGYDALEAVKYAERYWNDHHFAYPVFANDCTNFISQCLYAGGAKMHGESRTSGWWIRNGSWSYSWTTAHALYLYLKHAKSGLRGVFVSDPRELLLGDIICYDFEGDGRFNHTTIVVNKNAEGEPFVNAHTTNSRQRFWSYTDSTAYTPNIQYAWIQIHI